MNMKRKASTKPQKPYWEMNAEELQEATAEFDGPIDPMRLRPLSRKDRELFNRLQDHPVRAIHERTAGRRQSAGKKQSASVSAQEVIVRIDNDLLSQATAYAKRHKTSLPKMIDRSLRGLLSSGNRSNGRT